MSSADISKCRALGQEDCLEANSNFQVDGPAIAKHRWLKLLNR